MGMAAQDHHLLKLLSSLPPTTVPSTTNGETLQLTVLERELLGTAAKTDLETLAAVADLEWQRTFTPMATASAFGSCTPSSSPPRRTTSPAFSSSNSPSSKSSPDRGCLSTTSSHPTQRVFNSALCPPSRSSRTPESTSLASSCEQSCSALGRPEKCLNWSREQTVLDEDSLREAPPSPQSPKFSRDPESSRRHRHQGEKDSEVMHKFRDGKLRPRSKPSSPISCSGEEESDRPERDARPSKNGRTHANNGGFKCKHCGKYFLRKLHLLKHKQKHDAPRDMKRRTRSHSNNNSQKKTAKEPS